MKSTAAMTEQPSITAFAKASGLVAALSAASTAQAHSWAAAAVVNATRTFVATSALLLGGAPRLEQTERLLERGVDRGGFGGVELPMQ